MYGIVIEAVRYMIEDHYGSATLALVMEQAHVANATFSTHDRYSEKIIPNLLLALSDITGNSMEDVGILAGRYFIRFMTKYAEDLLKVLGRRFSDFVKGLDSLHEYFRFSYERIRPPSFYCDRETTDGLTLHYRSRRRGYVSYVMGQLIEIAKIYFDQDITVEMTRREEKKGFLYVLLRVTFDNRDYNADQMLRDKNMTLNEFLPVDSLSVLSMFPYFIAFNRHMEIVVVGRALNHIIPDLVSKRLDEQFDLVRPCVKFTWDACQHHLNNLFELHSNRPVLKLDGDPVIAVAVNDMVEEKVRLPVAGMRDEEEEEADTGAQDGHPADQTADHLRRNGRKHTLGNYLHLKGPMVYLKHAEINIYLPTVLIDALDNLFELGLYMNDYSDSDCNREIIMASAQKPDDLKELLKREKEKSRTLAKNMREIDQARKTAKELLTQLVPKEIANELLQTGKRSMTLCETYDEVTLAFVKIVDFNIITSGMPPMGVVSLLNNTFLVMDEVVTKHGVYKVETIGECYVISCGVPYPTQNHTEYIADMALDMIQTVEDVKYSIIDGKTVAIKIGVHAGPVVGSVVGVRAPRFCLFGDTVNCTSRMETHNKQPMTIQVSVKAKVLLENCAPGQFQFENRGKVNLKGKGEMLAFGLLTKKGAPRYERFPLSQKTGADSDEDDRSLVYTPMEDFEQNSRASTMSRMSISMAGSRTASASSGGNEERQASGEEEGLNAPTPTPAAPLPVEQPSYLRRMKTPPAKAVNGVASGSGAVNTVGLFKGNQVTEETRRQMKKAKEKQKERRRQAKSMEKDRRKGKPQDEDSGEDAAR